MSLGENIRARRLELGISQGELAKRSGYSSASTINKIESNLNGVPEYKLNKIAKALETTPADLLSERRQKDEWVSADIVDIRTVPVIKRVDGEDFMYKENFVNIINIPTSMLNKKYSELFAIYMAGDSLVNEGIKNGDLLVFRKTDEVNEGNLGIFLYEDRILIRRLVKAENGLLLVAANNRYPAFIVKDEKELKALGQLEIKLLSE